MSAPANREGNRLRAFSLSFSLPFFSEPVPRRFPAIDRLELEALNAFQSVKELQEEP